MTDTDTRITSALNAELDEFIASERIRTIRVPAPARHPAPLAIRILNSWGCGTFAMLAVLAVLLLH